MHILESGHPLSFFPVQLAQLIDNSTVIKKGGRNKCIFVFHLGAYMFHLPVLVLALDTARLDYTILLQSSVRPCERVTDLSSAVYTVC